MLIKSLGKHTLIYGAGHILARLVSFLLLPLYTNVFSAEEYGVVSLAYAFLGFMGVVLHYGLDASLMKHYVPADQQDRKKYLSNTYASYLVTSGVFFMILLAFRSILAPVILGDGHADYIPYLAGILALDILWSVPMLILRSEEKPYYFITMSLMNVGLSLSLNLYFVLSVKMGIEGVFLSNLITSGVLWLLTLPIIIPRVSAKMLSFPVWQKLMRFGLPFLLSGIFAMMMELADRYLLSWMTNLEAVGFYSAGYKLGMFMLLVVMGFNMGWQPFFLKDGDWDEKKKLFSRVTSYVLWILGFIWVMLIIWVDTLIQFDFGGFTFYGEEFWSSTSIVFWIALGYYFDAMYLLQLPGPFLTNKSGIVAWTRALGAGVNIGLNILLIPQFGAMGAAFATCASFGIMAVFLFIMNRKIYPINYEWAKLLRIGLSLLVIGIIAMNYTLTIGLKFALTAAFPVVTILSGMFTSEEISKFKKLFVSDH